MENYDVDHFNEQMRVRTKVFAINVYKMMNAIRLNDLSRIPPSNFFEVHLLSQQTSDQLQEEDLKLSSIPRFALLLKNVMNLFFGLSFYLTPGF